MVVRVSIVDRANVFGEQTTTRKKKMKKEKKVEMKRPSDCSMKKS
jgi:hypothetical protein